MSTLPDAMRIASFPAGTCIEISDIMTGARKIGVVTEGGTMYLDDVGPRSTPFVIYQALNPRNLGTPNAWAMELAESAPAQQQQFSILQHLLLDDGVDSITLYRALHHAYSTRTFDKARCLAVAQSAARVVTESRATMDRIIARSQAVV